MIKAIDYLKRMAKEEKKVHIELEIPESQLEVKTGGLDGDGEGSNNKEKKSNSDSDEDQKSLVTRATGYKAGEILKAPLDPPSAQTSRTPIRGQLRSLIFGFTFIVLALLAWPIFGWSVAVAVVIIGATFIALGVLVRV